MSDVVETTDLDALRQALRAALREDERVFLMGEDAGAGGDRSAVSRGLLQEFGPERVRNTPLTGSALVGAGIGAAIRGLRPIVELTTVHHTLRGLDQLVDLAAGLLHLSGGQYAVPLVLRATTGHGRRLPVQHRHSLEGWCAHVPGLRLAAPATLEDARGMLATALADPDPVLLVEHAGLYDLRGTLASEAGAVDIDHAVVRRPGDDVTLVTYGGMLGRALEAADALAADGVSAEVVDLRTLRPIDELTVVASVRRTHRAVVVDEGWRSGSLSAELAARIQEQAFEDLEAPVARVCSAEVPVPYPHHLEAAALPRATTIADAARRAMAGRPA